MGNTLLLPVISLVLLAILATILRGIWQSHVHARLAKHWGCKPAVVRPYRLPFAIDIMKRYFDTNSANDAQNDDERVFAEMGRRPTWYQQVLGNWHYVTTDPANIQAMLATQFQDFELGHLRRAIFDPLLGNGIFTSDGKAWEHDRAMLRPQFTRSQISDLRLEETHVQALFDHVSGSVGQWTAPIDLRPLFFHLTLDSATEFLFGESVYSQALHNNIIKNEKQSLSALDTHSGLEWSAFGGHFDSANQGIVKRYRLFDLYFLYNTASFRNSCRQVHKCIDYFVDQALSRDIDAKDDRYVFLNALAKTTRDRMVLRTQALNILLAGRDTTAGLLSWVFYFLARHPHVYARLRQIILQDFGTSIEKLSFESLKSCVYLQHVMNETLRLEPLVPENERHAVKNTTLPRGGGPDGQSPIYIRAGQGIAYNTRIMHRRIDLWGEDAAEFNPDRWQGARPGWKYLPFNGGPRICIGQQFALTEAGYVIVRMLQQYESMENLDDKPLKHRFVQTTSPMEVLVKLRRVQ